MNVYFFGTLSLQHDLKTWHCLMAFLFLKMCHTYCPIRGPEIFTLKQHLPLVLSRSPAPISFYHKILFQIMMEQLPMLQNCWRIREQCFQDIREGKKEEKERKVRYMVLSVRCVRQPQRHQNASCHIKERTDITSH